MSLSELLTGQPWAITPQVLESLCDAFNSFAHKSVGGDAYSALPSSRTENGNALYTLRGRVALIEVSGVIHRRSGHALCFSWRGQDEIRSAIDEAVADPSAAAVLLSFDSPGGVAAGVKELADHIAGQSEKPVYAYADGLCASAAYWLASACGRLYAPATAAIGSIGVLQVHCDRSAANSAEGVRYTYITGGTWKASGHGDAPLSGADQAYLQGMVNQLHSIFRSDVAAHMGIDVLQAESWGDGQIFLAAEALELGLISGIAPDRETLIAQINKETSMDKEKLAREHPDLLAAIKKEAALEVKTEAEKIKAAALDNQLALVKMVAGEEAAVKVASLSKAGFTAAQIEALGNLGFSALSDKQQAGVDFAASQEASGRLEIMNLLRQATPGPVSALPNIKDQDAVTAAIDRISAI